MVKRLKRWGLATALVSSLVFVLAGTLSNPWLWAYFGVWAAMAGYAMLGLDEDLAKERFRPPTPGADRIAVTFLRVLALAHLVIGALDAGRWHLTTQVPNYVRVPALTGMAIGLGMFYRAMRENQFFSAVVRIQSDRGHRVIDTGPYAIVRHPGYAGLILVPPLSGLALGSWLAVAAGLVISVLVVRRVLFEDAFLRAHLEGYGTYAGRVPYRLIPGVW